MTKPSTSKVTKSSNPLLDSINKKRREKAAAKRAAAPVKPDLKKAAKRIAKVELPIAPISDAEKIAFNAKEEKATQRLIKQGVKVSGGPTYPEVIRTASGNLLGPEAPKAEKAPRRESTSQNAISCRAYNAMRADEKAANGADSTPEQRKAFATAWYAEKGLQRNGLPLDPNAPAPEEKAKKAAKPARTAAPKTELRGKLAKAVQG